MIVIHNKKKGRSIMLSGSRLNGPFANWNKTSVVNLHLFHRIWRQNKSRLPKSTSQYSEM